MKRYLILAFVAMLSAQAFAQKAYRVPLVSIAAGAKSATFKYSNFAEMGDAAKEVIWYEFTASTNIALYSVAYDGGYSNLIYSLALTAATTTNLAASLGIWPASDTLLYTIASTNAGGSFRAVLKVTK